MQRKRPCVAHTASADAPVPATAAAIRAARAAAVAARAAIARSARGTRVAPSAAVAAPATITRMVTRAASLRAAEAPVAAALDEEMSELELPPPALPLLPPISLALPLVPQAPAGASPLFDGDGDLLAALEEEFDDDGVADQAANDFFADLSPMDGGLISQWRAAGMPTEEVDLYMLGAGL